MIPGITSAIDQSHRLFVRPMAIALATMATIETTPDGILRSADVGGLNPKLRMRVAL